jgi:hypothetical protein
MASNKFNSSVKSAHQKHAVVLASLEKIQSIISSKVIPAVDMETAQIARLNLEDCVARHALDESSIEEVGHAKTQLEDAERVLAAQRQLHESVSVEFAGLNRRLAATQAEVDELQSAIVEAEKDWLAEELRNSDAIYYKHALALRDAYLRVMACAWSIKRRGGQPTDLLGYVGDIQIPAIGNQSSGLAPNDQRRPEEFLFRERRPVTIFLHIDIEKDLKEVFQNESAKPSRLSSLSAAFGMN